MENTIRSCVCHLAQSLGRGFGIELIESYELYVQSFKSQIAMVFETLYLEFLVGF
jgi:hypothetical protein